MVGSSMNHIQPVSIKKILVPIDFSYGARAAFYTALQMASVHEAEVVVLHVSEPIRAFDFSKRRFTETQEAIERVEEGVNRRLDELWAAGGTGAVDRRKVHLVVRGGKAAKEILETANIREVDLIVMGARGADSASSGVGAVADRVLCGAECSVFCVKLPAA